MLGKPPERQQPSFTASEMSGIASNTNQFIDCMQTLNYQLQPKISACLNLDAGSQEFIRALTESQQQSCDQNKHGGDHENSDTEEEESYDSALHNLHQNLDEKLALAKRMLQIARERSSEMQQILANVQTLQNRAKVSGQVESVEPAESSRTIQPSNDVIFSNQSREINPNIVNEPKMSSGHRKVAKPRDNSKAISQSRAVKNKIRKLKNATSRVKVSKPALQSAIIEEGLKIQTNTVSKSKKKSSVSKSKAIVDAASKKANSVVKQEPKEEIELSKSLADSDQTLRDDGGSRESMETVDHVKPEPIIEPVDDVNVDNEQKSNDESEKEPNSEASSSKTPQQSGNISSSNSNTQSSGGGNGKSPSKQLTKSYCVCKEPFNSDMVACDNRHCKIEWFHFRCVGLTDAPKGRWFCTECSKGRNVRQTPSRQAKK